MGIVHTLYAVYGSVAKPGSAAEAKIREIVDRSLNDGGDNFVCIGNDGISVVVCDPAGDEVATAKRMAAFLDKALWSQIGVTFTNDDPVQTGSMA